jgi:hypothetical protein
MLRKKVVHFLFNNEAGSLFKPGNPHLVVAKGRGQRKTKDKRQK